MSTSGAGLFSRQLIPLAIPVRGPRARPTRSALLLGTILGTGILLIGLPPDPAMGQSIEQIITTPTPGASGNVGGTDTITIRSSGAGALGAIETTSVDGSTTIELGASVTVTAGDAGVYAVTTGSGSINITTNANGAVTSSTGDPDAASAIGAVTTRAEGGGATTITLGAAVRGDATGVDASSEKNGTITLKTTTGGTITGESGFGVIARSIEGDIDLGGAEGLAGAISGRRGGIYAWSNDGSITVRTVTGGTVTGGAGFHGITADALGGGKTISLSLGADVTGGASGVYATGAGDISIASASGVTIAGATGSGIYAKSSGGAVTIGGPAGLGGPVTGRTGIYAEAAGANTIDVKANGDVTGTTGAGITTVSVDGATTIDIGAGATVTGGTNGVKAVANGAGAITITSATGVTIKSTATSAVWNLPSGFAISAQSAGGAVNVGGVAGLGGPVTGAGGIRAVTTGQGTVTVKTAAGGLVTASDNGGILTTADSGATTIDIGAKVDAHGYGVWAVSRAGSITVTAGTDASIEGLADGINARSDSGNINIGGATGLASRVFGGSAAINATTGGSGGISIKTAAGGVLTGDGDYAILTSAGTGATTIELGDAVSGVFGGVRASGGGTITLTTAAGVTISGGQGYGVRANSTAGDVNIGGVAGLSGAIGASEGGIYAKADIGSVTVKTVRGGTVTSDAGIGVETNADAGATIITLGADVTGATNGVKAIADGAGAITITSETGVTIKSTATGSPADASNPYGFGISADSFGGAIDVGGEGGLRGSVTGLGGIRAKNNGQGTITVRTAAGSQVTGTGVGVGAVAEGAARTTIDVGGAVQGGTHGVKAVSVSGSITVTAGTGASITGGDDYEAIYVKSDSGNIDIGGDTGLAGAVTGGFAIFANTETGGDIEIKTTVGGVLKGMRDDVSAVTAYSAGAATISLGAAVEGKGGGVDVTSSGSITLTTTAGGTITGLDGGGISALSAEGDIDLDLAGAVSGARGGIFARADIGSVTIKTVTGGAVTGGGRNGIQTFADAGATTISLGANVTGATSGVTAKATGAGAITIKSGAGVTIDQTGALPPPGSPADQGYAISAESAGGAIDIGGTAGLGGPVTGQRGIRAKTSGGGTIKVTTAAGGLVTANTSDAVLTEAGSGATTITLGANVYGGAFGVRAYSVSGSITLTAASGVRIESGGAEAIRVESTSGDIFIGDAAGLSGAVTTSATAIYAKTAGPGMINIKTVVGGGITSDGGNGVEVSAGTGATTIALGDNVTAGNSGVSVSSGGAITLTTATGVRVIGANDGIKATSTAGAIDIGVAAGLGGLVQGATGIHAQSAGANTISVKANANVTGTLGEGISTIAETGATTIAIGAAATVTGSTYAIKSTTQSGPVTIDNAGSVKGALLGSGAGTRTFNNSGGLVLMGAQSNTGFTVNNLSGGVLTGTGAFGAVRAQAGSTIRPGDRTVTTMGVMTMSSLNMAAGAKLEVRADVSGVNDRLVVSGGAVIENNATLRLLATPQTDAAWSADKRFTVLRAGSLTGNFTNTETDYAFLKVTAVKEGNDVIATLARNWVSFRAYATTPNQIAVSNTLDTFQSQTTNPLIASATTLTVAKAPEALTQLAGAGIAVTRRMAYTASGIFTGAIDSELGKFTGSVAGSSERAYAPAKALTISAFETIAPKPAPTPDGRVWAQALGAVGMIRSDVNNPAEQLSLMGLAAGADAPLTPNLRAGFAFAGGQSNGKVSALGAKAEATWGQGAVYAVATAGESYAKAVLVYGHLRTDSTRNITALPSPETAKGKFGANLFTMRFEVGQKVVTGGPVDVTPFFSFEPTWLMQNSFAETGAPIAGLTYGRIVARDLPATLGVKIDAAFALEGLQVRPSATLGWVHNLAARENLAPSFTSLPGSTFTVTNAKGDRNTARAELSFEAAPDGAMASFHARARADIGPRSTSVRGTAGMTMRF